MIVVQTIKQLKVTESQTAMKFTTSIYALIEKGSIFQLFMVM